jgi:membrane protein required for colicin V production|tara:strand:+ start:231 stop:767 length:537 start_codon:yes stop_codon:yes gene_type:complete
MIYHIPFPFPVTFPIDIFGSEEVISILDFILILILGISSIYGFFKGFLTEVLSLLTWIIAVSVAYALGSQFEIIFEPILTSEVLRLWVSRLLILALILFIGGLASRKASKTFGSSISGDMFFGLGFGFLRGLVLICLLMLILEDTQLYAEPIIQDAVFLKEAEQVKEFFYNLFLQYYN